MTDDSLMPYGEHKGKKLANVPANYLLYLLNNNRCTPELKEYIDDNYDVLWSELTEQERKEFE